MTCETAQRLLYLDRPSERSERETRDLQAHLRTCTACSAEAAAQLTWARQRDRLRTGGTYVPDLRDVRERVLRLTSEDARRSYPRTAFRFAASYGLAVLCVAVWFGVSQWNIRSAHEDLLLQPAGDVVAPGPQIVYTVDATAAKGLVRGAIPLELQSLEGTVVISQARSRALLASTESYLVRTFAERPARRAQVDDALRMLRSVVGVAIRYRPQGA